MVGAGLVQALAATAAGAGTTDLSSVLAPAPSRDWIEASALHSQVIEGAFTAKQYGDFVDRSNGTPGTTTSALENYGFTGGYGREWVQLGSRDLLVERVFAFDASSGANSWFSDIMTQTEAQSAYVGPIPAASAVPDSFGAVLSDPRFPKQWRVDFWKSNLVFVVHTDSRTSDLASLAVSQAQTEYNNAPTTTIQYRSQAAFPAWLVPAAAGTIALMVVVVIGVIVLVSLRSRRSGPAAAQLHLSPDGLYWWDGARWHDARTDVPPAAQRSPDGVYWWDGRAWRQGGS